MNTELSVTLKDGKIYKGLFKQPSLDTYELVFDNINEPFVSDTILAKNCFVEGDEELVDFDEHINLFFSYRNDLWQLLCIFPVNIEEKEGNIHIDITQSDNSGVISAVFRKPNFKELRKVMSFVDSGKIFIGQMELARLTFVDGDRSFIQFNKFPNLIASYGRRLLTSYDIGIADLKKK